MQRRLSMYPVRPFMSHDRKAENHLITAGNKSLENELLYLWV